MIRRPPRSTRTDTLFPYTTLFRSTLEVRDSGGGSWTFDRDNATLRVETPRTPFISWFGGGNGRAVLTLPDELEGADADFDLGAGSLTAAGAFGELELGMGAGDMTISGSAEELTADESAGRADIDLEGVRSAEDRQSAGLGKRGSD